MLINTFLDVLQCEESTEKMTLLSVLTDTEVL